MLYADRHLKSLEETVNKELKNVCEWLHVNKLTLNIKNSNFVIFRPPQRSLNYEIKLKVLDYNTNISSRLECKEYVKVPLRRNFTFYFPLFFLRRITYRHVRCPFVHKEKNKKFSFIIISPLEKCKISSTITRNWFQLSPLSSQRHLYL